MRVLIFCGLLVWMSLLPAQKFPKASSHPTTAPRTMAEWEEVEYLVVTWAQYYQALTEIIRYGREECKVLVVCSDSVDVKMHLRSAGVPLKGVYYVEAPFNSIWIRDYGPNSVYANTDDSLKLIDWVYNRPRPYDDRITTALSDHTGLSHYSTQNPPWDLVHTGGNFLIDGMGTAFSSKLILEENALGGKYNLSQKSESDIDHIMKSQMGIEHYLKLTPLEFDGINHVDMHMQLLDEETLLVGEYPLGIADGPTIEANLRYIMSESQTAFGNSWEIIRIPMPPHRGAYPDTWWAHFRTYTNMVFLNKTVLVPTYEAIYDSVAFRILRKNLPGYRIVGIDCNAVIRSGGALHCITRTIGVSDPLLIQHSKVREFQQAGEATEISGVIRHRTGIARATLHYALDSKTDFQAVSMRLIDPDSHLWKADLQLPEGDHLIRYYISAEANSGKKIRRPMTAPKGHWTFKSLETLPDPDNLPVSLRMDAISPVSKRDNNLACVPIYVTHSTHASLKIFDAWGREMMTLFEGRLNPGERSFFWDTSALIPGQYSILVETAYGKRSQTLVISE